MGIKKVGVVGFSGVMGSGIAQLCASCGYEVIGCSRNADKNAQALERIGGFLGRAVEKGKLSEQDKMAALARIEMTTDMDLFAGCDIVIESVAENIDLKRDVFAALDRVCAPDTILASNTSSLSIIDMAMCTRRPNKVLGFHFFNPAPVMNLLEVVKTIATDEATLEAGKEFGRKLGKNVVVARDAPGYIVNSLLIPYLLNAIRMLDRGQASREDIDIAVKLGLNNPMGPLALSDFIGLDTLLFVADVIYEDSKDAQYAAPSLLKKMVTAGWLGKKSGKGFYEYK